MRATIVRLQLDTVLFEGPAAAHHCQSDRGVLLDALKDGNGVLIWLRPGDSAGLYPVLGVRDTITPRGAIVAVRYMTGDVSHGLSLDSGTVTVAGDHRGLEVRGSGLETPGALRPFVALDFTPLPRPTDSASCEPYQ